MSLTHLFVTSRIKNVLKKSNYDPQTLTVVSIVNLTGAVLLFAFTEVYLLHAVAVQKNISKDELEMICGQYSLEMSKLIIGSEIEDHISKALKEHSFQIVNHYNELISKNRLSDYSAVNKRAVVARELRKRPEEEE